jgi:predicted transcriptional regulator
MMYERMKRTTISLPDDLAAAVERAARQRHLTVSELSRQALRAHLGLVGDTPRRLAFADLGRSGQANVSQDMEDLLRTEWGSGR